MKKEISLKSIIKELRTSDFVLGCRMPIGYSAGLPVLQIKNGGLCLLVPYLKYKVTGEVDKTLVFPIRYTVTVELPQGTPVAFEDLSFNARFKKVDFSRPVGLFRHDSIKQYSKQEYHALRDELLTMYDKVVDALLYSSEYAEADDIRMKELLHILPEPSLLPIYKALDSDFYAKYMA